MKGIHNLNVEGAGHCGREKGMKRGMEEVKCGDYFRNYGHMILAVVR